MTAAVDFARLHDFARRAIERGLAAESYRRTGAEYRVLDAHTQPVLVARLSSAVFGGGFEGGSHSEATLGEMTRTRIAEIEARLPALSDLWGDPATWPQVRDLLIDAQPADVRYWRPQS